MPRASCAARKPDVVLGMGGYVCFPGGMMARAARQAAGAGQCRRGAAAVEQDAAPLAQRVLFGFPADFGSAAGKAIVTGNPVREEILRMPAPAQRFAGRSGPLRLLVVGGSLGAKALERLRAGGAGADPAGRSARWSTHQSGKKQIDALRAAYADAGVQAERGRLHRRHGRAPMPRPTW